MPDRQLIESEAPLQAREPGDEEKLDEHEVRAQQAREPPRAGQLGGRAAEPRRPSVAPPQPDDHQRVGDKEQPQIAGGRREAA